MYKVINTHTGRVAFGSEGRNLSKCLKWLAGMVATMTVCHREDATVKEAINLGFHIVKA